MALKLAKLPPIGGPIKEATPWKSNNKPKAFVSLSRPNKSTNITEVKPTFGFKGSNSAGVALLSINAFFLIFASLGTSKGLNMAPNIIQFRTIPPIINNAPLQPKLPIKCSVKGAKTNVPKPEPHTAIPVAKERRASNHTLTLTMAGR
uniref:Uncharacterized protein n=1 Tax=Glossina palpalis gambiensis TaxID=67801 RepID=A0A1B0ALY6_9MUSC